MTVPNVSLGFPSNLLHVERMQSLPPHLESFSFVRCYRDTPASRSLREAIVKEFEAGHIHKSIHEDWGEPSWIGQNINDID